MSVMFDNVVITTLPDNGQLLKANVSTRCVRLGAKSEKDKTVLIEIMNGVEVEQVLHMHSSDGDVEIARCGAYGVVISTSVRDSIQSYMLRFPTVHAVKHFYASVKEYMKMSKSMFSYRTDEASAVQYFQFYGYLSQQQNMMQDYIRTSTYQRAMLTNARDFQGKVVLDVGAGSGILSFFAIQAGARRVYAIEASSMAKHCETLVANNNLSHQIFVITGKVEEVDVPEFVDTIISEPMGYMLFNERMLESYLHAKKWLKPQGKMYPAQGDLHIAPFTDEALYMEQYSKANFWYQESFHGVNLCSLRNNAVMEYFKQPIVDTFDIRICLAKSNKYTINFQSAKEEDLHVVDIPLNFTMLQGGMIHGLAFWFEVGFLGSDFQVWLSTAPTEPLTHWYQVRCLVDKPVLVKHGQSLTGRVLLQCNSRQSYDVDIELNIPGTAAKSYNTLDLKNPFFRYTGVAPQPPPGNCTSATEQYWNSLTTDGGVTDAEGNITVLANEHQQQAYVNGYLNGNVIDLSQHALQPQLQQQANIAPVNPGSIPAVGPIGTNINRALVGDGLSPVINTQSVITGGTSHYPISNQFMIGDYVMQDNVLVHQNQQHTSSLSVDKKMLS